jgi:putative transposase
MHRKVETLFPLRWRDTTTWPKPADKAITPANREAYEQRKRAIESYMKGEPLTSICKDEGIDADTLYRLLEACAKKDADGNIWGFRALVPYTRQKAYSRSSPVDSNALAAGRGAGGLFQQLLARHESLRTLLQEQAAKYAKKEKPGRIPVRKEHGTFLNKLVKLQGKAGYPFTLQNHGREGYRQALHEAIAQLRGEGRGSLKTSIERAFRPQTDARYRQVQIDAHRLDKFVRVRFIGRKGRFKTRLLRPWLIAAVEVDSGSCLGWSLCVEKECSQLDLLRCLYNMMNPWKRRTYFEIEELDYKPSAGMPSGSVPRCAGRYADSVSLDNALCGHADNVRDVVLLKLHATLRLGLPGEPRTRAEIEQLFNTLTHRNVQHLIGGVHPKMSNRDREAAMTAAEENGMTIEQMEEYLDVVLSNYNGHPTSAHYGKSPLDFLREEPPGALIRADTTAAAPWRDLLKVERLVTVKGGDGHAPHINYLKATYTNDLLRSCDMLVGKEIVVTINLLDLRAVEAQVPGSISLGTLYANGPWAQFEHDERLRKRLNREIEDGNFFWEEGKDPEEIVDAFLRKARRSAAAQPDPAKTRPSPAPQPTHRPAPPASPSKVIAAVAKSVEFDLEKLLGSKLKG